MDRWMGDYATFPFKTGQLVHSSLLPWLTSITQICSSCGKMVMPEDSKLHLRRLRRRSTVSCVDCWTLIYRHYSDYLQLFLMIKHSWPHPVIQLSSHRLNWFKQVIMKLLQILLCLSLRKLPCPSMFMQVCLMIWLPCEFWCSQTLHVSVSVFFFFLDHC